MSIGICRTRTVGAVVSATNGEEEFVQRLKAPEPDFESLSVAEGGVGGQLCSSGDGGSRCEVRNREPGNQSGGAEPCLPELLRRNLSIIVSPRRASSEVKSQGSTKTAGDGRVLLKKQQFWERGVGGAVCNMI